MAERTMVTDVVQLGVETTPGTTVPANRFLPTLKLNPGVDGSFTNVRPSGGKFITLNVLGKEWSTGGITMDATTYDEITFIFASALRNPTPVVQGATTAYLWTFEPQSTAADVLASYTMEQGSAVSANKFGHGIIPEFTLTGNRDAVNLSGNMIGQLFTTGITLTVTPTAIPLVPINPFDVDVYLDPTSATLGATKLSRVFSWEIGISNRVSPLWVVDSTKPSFVTVYENAIEATVKLSMEADTQGMNLLTQMRAGSTAFLRIEAVSDALAGIAFPYKLTMDHAVQVADTPKQFGDVDGVVSIDWTFNMVFDATWGKALSYKLINKRGPTL